MGEEGATSAAASPSQPGLGRQKRLRRRRVFVGDDRNDGRYLRMTWHSEKAVFVLSTWTEDVCTGSVRIPVDRAPELVSLLVDGLGDALSHPPAKPGGEEAERPPGKADRLRAWLGLRGSGKRRSGSRGARKNPGPATGATILKLR